MFQKINIYAKAFTKCVHAFTLAEGATHVDSSAEKDVHAFTLAEVLITLGVIGVVVAMTLPVVMSKVQSVILKNQFKTAYSKLSQAVLQTQARMDYGVGCFYWMGGQLCKEVCTKREPVYGNCIEFKCENGSSLPANQNGLRDDCAVFEEELFTKTLKVVKFCQNNALAEGCLTDKYRGTDKIKKEQNPNVEPDPNRDFSDSNIKNRYSAWILADGTLIIKYGNYKARNFPLFTIDVNGHKGPNKWGYDIFTLGLQGDIDGIKKLAPYSYAVEKGGKSSQEILEEF